MTSKQLYKNFEIKINRNDTNRNIKVNEGIFVKIFNEQAPLWLKDQIENNSSSDLKNDVAEFLVLDTPLQKDKDTENYSSFVLPSDFFKYGSSYTLAKKGDCTNRKLRNWDFKIKSRNAVEQDTNNSPSFEYEETLVNFAGNNILVFKTDFEVEKEFLSYYILPTEIDIAGYIKEDGSHSKDIDFNFTKFTANKIIDWCVLETIRIFENPDGYALSKERILKK